MKELLERARAADTLSPEAHARMRAGLLEKLARGEGALPGIDASPLVVPKLGFLAKWIASAAGKLGLLVVGATIVVVAVLISRREASAPAVVRSTSSQVAPSQPVEAHVATPELIPSQPGARPAVISAPGAMSEAHAPWVQRAKREKARARITPRVPEGRTLEEQRAPEPDTTATDVSVEAPAVTPDEAPPTATRETSARPPTTLDAELGLLRSAYSALNAGHAQRAFDVLDEHARRFPRGELQESREVARMLALCAMDRAPAARARARQFLASYPDSPFVGRVRNMCPPPAKK